jgi:hypothetical protein
MRADLFNAFHRSVENAQNGEPVHRQGQAQCYYHPGKIAVVPCSSCGRLLCSLCEIPFDEGPLCTNCLQSGRKNRQIPVLERSRFLYDSFALALAVWPVIFLPFIFITFITAPAAIYIVLRYWRASSNVVPRSKYRFVLAFLFAVAQLVAWAVLITGILS